MQATLCSERLSVPPWAPLSEKMPPWLRIGIPTLIVVDETGWWPQQYFSTCITSTARDYIAKKCQAWTHCRLLPRAADNTATAFCLSHGIKKGSDLTNLKSSANFKESTAFSLVEVDCSSNNHLEEHTQVMYLVFRGMGQTITSSQLQHDNTMVPQGEGGGEGGAEAVVGKANCTWLWAAKSRSD